jgi:nitrogen fixation protein FixH
MNPSTPTKSWWPYGLIVFFIVFISWIGTFITFAVRQDIHLVRTDYYRAEVAHQDEIDRQSRAAQLGHEVVIEYSARHGRLGVKIPAGHATAQPAGEVFFYRPDNPMLDHSVTLQPSAEGRQFIDVTKLAPGSWRVRMEWRVGDVEFAKSDRIAIVRTM